MKPFELTVYPRTDAGDYTDPEHGYRIHHEDVEVFVYQKRLTNAELAAEYWRASGGSAEVNYNRDVNVEPISRILHRFATLPSYDEVPE